MTATAMLDAAIGALRASLSPEMASDLDSLLIRRRPELLMQLGPLVPNHDRVVTLNLGLGRDSLTMLCLLVDGELVADGRRLAVDEVDAVVFADPGEEWPSTIDLLPRVRELCRRHGLRLVVLAKPPEAVTRAWLDSLPPPGAAGRRRALDEKPWRHGTTIEEKAASGWYHLRPNILDDYGSRCTIATRSSKDCTQNHKIDPIRKLVNDLAVDRWGVDNVRWGADVRAGRRRPHLTLVGIASDEMERAIEAHPLRGGNGPWYVTEAYPLIEMGIAKPDEAKVLDACGFADAHKSGCVICPFQPVGWYWALRETHPDRWARVVEYEQRALAANPRMFVVGDLPVAQAVEQWREKNPRATVQEVLTKSYRRCGTQVGQT